MVPEERDKLAGFAKGVVEHVIRMDSGCRFVPVPEGVKILMNTRKVLRVKFVQPHAQCVLDSEAVRAKAQKLVEEEKQEMLKLIAIETGKQKCTKDKIEKDYRRKEINSTPMKRSFLEVLASNFSRQFKAHANRRNLCESQFSRCLHQKAQASEKRFCRHSRR
jgi:hypothetical protein